MKIMHIKKFWMVLAMALVGLCTIGCSDDDDEGGSKENPISANDPEGTIIANLANTFHETGNWYFDDGIMITYDGYDYTEGYLGMNSSNNLQAQGYGSSYDAEIVSVGKVNGLSSIKNIPETGWSHQAAAIPGYGYVYRHKYINGGNYHYARIYAVDYITSTSGGIMGITIKYQQNWEPDSK